ncbi:MAG: cytidine deaminase [Bacteroidia bacterium]|nr:cytidine deaminase [Bacteroidia bacterium]
MKQFLQIEYEWFDNSESLSDDEQTLLKAALEATQTAYAPYSEFYVGAAVLLSTGEILTGSNQENAAFPSGLCAERTLLFSVGISGKANLIQKLAVRAKTPRLVLDQPVFPCGACRQVMQEYEEKCPEQWIILMQGEMGGILRIKGVKGKLLPFTFQLR